jgi:hypothetical protein
MKEIDEDVLLRTAPSTTSNAVDRASSYSKFHIFYVGLYVVTMKRCGNTVPEISLTAPKLLNIGILSDGNRVP